jgi:hypothetical protein
MFGMRVAEAIGADTHYQAQKFINICQSELKKRNIESQRIPKDYRMRMLSSVVWESQNQSLEKWPHESLLLAIHSGIKSLKKDFYDYGSIDLLLFRQQKDRQFKEKDGITSFATFSSIVEKLAGRNRLIKFPLT